MLLHGATLPPLTPWPCEPFAADVRVVLGRHGLSRLSVEAEFAVQRRLTDVGGLPIPRLLAHGQLYDGPEPWPYLVTTRMAGLPWREVALSPRERSPVAGQLGELMRTVHGVAVPDAPVFATSRLTERGTDPSAWHRQVLPRRLSDQIDGYLVRDWPDRRLVHADLTEDHVFVTAGGELAGVIDWGDAQATDPHYELGPLQVLTFRGDKALLRAFLDGYGWERTDDFARRAMSASLMHRKSNLFSALDAIRPLDTFRTIDELADFLWLW